MSELVIPLIFFSISMCITPGPNNMMLTASGANFGFKRTIPHILGIEFGLILMFCLCAFGLGVVFQSYPLIQTIVKWVSVTYLFFLALRIAMMGQKDGKNEVAGEPLRFYQAMLFQIVNPKVLLMAVTAMSTFGMSGAHYVGSALTIIVIFALVCIPSISVWACFGAFLRRMLKSPSAFRIFNILMGLLTAGSVVQIL